MSKGEIDVIAIDGPAGAGKGTVSKIIATFLGFHCLDSGAVYRVVALAAMWMKIPTSDENTLVWLAKKIENELDMRADGIFLSGDNVTDQIRTPEIDKRTPEIARIESVRKAVLGIQLSMRRAPGLVAEGRDMCYVFGDTPHKFFLTVSPEKQARRRVDQRGGDYEEVLAAIIKRDEVDRTREASPLQKHPDAKEIDTSPMTAEQVSAAILEKYFQKYHQMKV